MKFSIVFDNSGDTIPFVAINPSIVEYYVDCLTQHTTNGFWCQHPGRLKAINRKLSELHTASVSSNEWLNTLFDYSLPLYDQVGYLNQDNLNLLHAMWVKVQSFKCDIDSKRQIHNFQGLAESLHNMYPDSERFPVCGDIVYKIGKNEEFDSINDYVHAIEFGFDDLRFVCSDAWLEFDNVFSKEMVTNDVCNLSLPFNHLGRTQYNKFVNYDRNLRYNDENTFDQLLKFVSISLTTPQTMPYSKEYLTWCVERNTVPSGMQIPLGNIPDLGLNLAKYRNILLTNTMANNKFTICL